MSRGIDGELLVLTRPQKSKTKYSHFELAANKTRVTMYERKFTIHYFYYNYYHCVDKVSNDFCSCDHTVLCRKARTSGAFFSHVFQVENVLASYYIVNITYDDGLTNKNTFVKRFVKRFID